MYPPPPTPGTPNNPFPGYPHTSAHRQPWPQQRLISMPPVVQRGGGGSVGAGLSTGPHQLTPAVPELPSWVAQPAQLTVSSTDYLDPSVAQHRVLGPAPSRAKRRFSEVDCPSVQHAQVDFLNQHTLENQPAPDAYTSYPWSSAPPANSTAQYQGAVPADMVPGPSSLMHRESVVSLYSEESFRSSSSSGLQVDLDSNATFSPRYASPGAPSLAGQTLPQQGTSAPKPPRKKRSTGQRKRASNPKYPKAAERLQNQRESDDEHIKHLLELFVPGDERDGPKKGRLRLSTSQSLCLPS